MPETLPTIPVIDCGRAGLSKLAELMPEAANRLLVAARRTYTPALMQIVDRRSVAWLGRNDSRYVEEIREIADRLKLPGVSTLNISYEWTCTSSASGHLLARVLDWRFDGLGQATVVARCEGPTGVWYNVTWPGFVGALTAVKPGKYAAALNQAPLRHRTRILPIDWLIDRIAIDRSTYQPPTHLLREVFETCPDYDSALKMLTEAPMALPALFALSAADGRSVVIERQERSGFVHEGPATVANHWLSDIWRGRPRGLSSQERWALSQARALKGDFQSDFAWLEPPVLNRFTRLAALMNAKTGEMSVVGLERAGSLAAPSTQTLHLAAV